MGANLFQILGIMETLPEVIPEPGIFPEHHEVWLVHVLSLFPHSRKDTPKARCMLFVCEDLDTVPSTSWLPSTKLDVDSLPPPKKDVSVYWFFKAIYL